MDELTPQQDRQITVHIEDEMRGAYLDYAMSVIIGRALPDVRDGLKPVHRRVLYAMHDLGNAWNKAYKKSARVVGDVIGKYHPHGDTAVYDTMVRMAQDFSMRYPLIDGQGNFGSIDGDRAAAMRYTEVRMERITDELLSEIDKETVDFGPNYDDSLREPLLLPAKFPNLLVNGSSGIAVGMATNIPPHNLREIVDATVALIRDPSLKVEDLMAHVKGPDFPTGGAIMGGPGIKSAYLTGKGSITIRGKAEIETAKGDRERILISELPYQVNKAKLIERIAELVKEKRIEGIADLRDESDRTGMRVVIDVKKGESANILLNQLYSMTQLQENFGITLLAIQNHQPKVFNLRDMIWAFVEHRKDVVTRRTLFELRKAEARAHILEGLKRAVENLDAVIALIRGSRAPEEALSGLVAKFSFSDRQAQAILDMRLQRLTGLERDKILADYAAILKEIEELRSILADEKKVMALIAGELEDVKSRYGDDRRTELLFESATDFDVEDLIADEETLVTITHQGYIKRADPAQFRTQGRGGRGVKGMATQEGDFVTNLYATTTLTSLLCFTDKGRMHRLKVFKVPEASRIAKGKAIVNLISITSEEKVRAILPVKEFSENEFVVMVTKNGVIKKTALSEFKNVRASGINAISIEDDDQLVAAKLTNGNCEIMLSSAEGMGIRFPEANVRPMGRTAYGVNGMSLAAGDRVVGMGVLRQDDPDAKEVLVVTEKGYGKRTPIADYRLQGRGGKGIITMKITEKNGRVVAVVQCNPKEDLMLVSDRGQMIRTRVGEISEQGRAAQGVRVMTLEEGEKVVAVEPMAEASPEPGSNGFDA